MIFDRLLRLIPGRQDAVEYADNLCGYVDLRYSDWECLEQNGKPEEVAAHSAWTFRGLVESDGVDAFFEQPERYKRIMLNSLLTIGFDVYLDDLQKMEQNEAEFDRGRWEERFFVTRDSYMVKITKYMKKYPGTFDEYVETGIRAIERGENIFDPEVWDYRKKR